MMLEFREPRPVLAKVGDQWFKGMAHVLIDYGFEHHLYYEVMMDESREVWVVRQTDIRAQDNITAHRHPKPALAGTNPDGSVFNQQQNQGTDRPS